MPVSAINLKFFLFILPDASNFVFLDVFIFTASLIASKLKLSSIISRKVKLIKKGKNFLGLCPFHNEKTPSFSVSQDKGLYYCFGCHAGGDVFNFVMRHQGLSFDDAARILAEEAGVALEAESPQERQRRHKQKELEKINRYALAFFEHSLWAKEGKIARDYLKERGIPEDFAKAWRLGFGGVAKDFIPYLEAKKIQSNHARELGLISHDGRNSFFEKRLIFPILDEKDRLLGFGGRRLFEYQDAKYLNSKESSLFNKRECLFGLARAQESIRQTQRLILVEGYTDVLACHRAGLSQAVAALGTAFTSEHAGRCARLAKESLLLLDSDEAGQRASRKIAELLLRAKQKVLVAPLEAGEDPDSIVRKHGRESLELCVQKAMPAVEYFFEKAFAQMPASIEERAALAADLSALVLALDSGLERDLYLAQLSEQVGLTPTQLRQSVKQKKPQTRSKPRSQGVESTSEEAQISRGPAVWEVDILCELLLFPLIRERLSELEGFNWSPPVRALVGDLADSEVDLEEVFGNYVSKYSILRRLQSVEPIVDLDRDLTQERAERTFNTIKVRLEVRQVDEALHDVIRELRIAADKGLEIDELIVRKQQLTRRKRELLAST